MTRRQIRCETFQAVFMYEFYNDSEDEDLKSSQMKLFVEADMDFEGDESEREMISERVEAIARDIDRIDSLIEEASESWTIPRMNKVDLALLRLATYEMMAEHLDAGIAINEAVELAKEYGTDESPGFVNGVLGQIVRLL